jgi:hypothetical protein
MKLEKNWELYVSIIHTLSDDARDGFDFAKVYTTSEKELRNQFTPLLKENNLEPDEDVRIEFIGEGYYDLFNDHWNGRWIVGRIDKLLEEWIDYDLLEALVDPETAKRKFKENFSEFVYAVFQKDITDFPTKYITFAVVESDKALTAYEVFTVLERRGHQPAIIDGATGLWGNFNIVEINEMEPETLFNFLKEYEERSEFIEYVDMFDELPS